MTPDPRHVNDALAAAARLLESRARLAESVERDYAGYWGLSPQDLGIGDTPGFELPLAGLGAGLTYVRPRKRGELIPLYLTEQQLRLYRQKIRALCLGNPIALNVISAHQSYGIGEGFRYEASARKGHEKAPGVEALVEQAQTWIDAFTEHNDLGLREAEISQRIDVDGEAILRLFPRENGLLSVRTVEPEHVYSLTGGNDDDTFGIRTAPGDVETPTGYWIVTGIPDKGATPELVDASEVWHLKSQETPRNAKRGLSDFYAVYGEIVAAGDLLQSLVAMAKSRSKIAWVEKMEGSTIDVAQALAASQAAASVTDPLTGQSVNMESYKRGSILRTNSDIEFPTGNVSAADYLEVYAADLRLIAGRFAMPEYMLTADASNANYSSTLVAESPFVKKMQRRQDYLARALGRNRHPGPGRSLIWRQLAFAVERGLLSREVFRLIDVQVTGPTLTVRDVQKEAGVDQIYHALGAKSLTTIQLEQNLDPDEQAANFAKEKQAQADANPGQLPSVPGLDGQEQADPTEAAPAQESFTGEKRDSLGHKRCYSDGKQVPCANGTDAAEPKGGGPSGKAASPAAKTKPAKKANGQQGPGETSETPAPPEKVPSEKAERAKASAVRVDKSVQRYAEEYNEPRFAKVVNGVSHPDSEPMDVTAESGDLIEMKTMCVGQDDKLTMNSYAQVRKAVAEKAAGKTFHTVVSDDRKIFNAKGEGEHGDEKDRVYYYRRGIAGSARVGSLHRCDGEDDLKRLMAMKDDELPAAARRTDGHIAGGDWEFFQDAEGKGYKDKNTGKVFRAKK